MTDALKAFLAQHPRSFARDIKDHLCEFPEFAKGLKRNSSAIYNVLKKLKDREEIIHYEDGSYSLVDGNEAPSAKPTGAPEAGEVGASPDDAPPLFRAVK